MSEAGAGSTTGPEPRGAVRLIFHSTDDDDDVSAAKKKKKPKEGCPTLSVTCKPTMASCSPVAQCAKFDHPGCSPLECSPVATAPPKAAL